MPSRRILLAAILAALVAPTAVACSAGEEESASSASSVIGEELRNVSFKTMRGTYLGARNNGGADLLASATVKDVWERFTIVQKSGEVLQSGDLIVIRAGGGQFLQAVGGGGTGMNAASANELEWETFRIVRAAGAGPIRSGDVVGLQTVVSGKWVSAENGGGGAVFAYGEQLGDWEKLIFEVGDATPAPMPSPQPSPEPAPQDWSLVWADEFDGNAIDRSKWTVESWGSGVFNNEAQSYADRPENVRVENGVLVIEARKDGYVPPNMTKGNPEAKYSSARLHSKGKASFTYGRFEARLQVPSGRGTWPAFWMLGENIDQVSWPACGEIDIMEHVGYEPDVLHGTTHSPTNFATNGRSGKQSVPGMTSEFHVFSAEWSPDHIDFQVDGQTYFTDRPPSNTPEAWPFTGPQHMLLNLAIGGAWGGANGIDDAIFDRPVKMLVDYVRVYQKR